MQIDMHYYGVYVLARMAGLTKDASEVIATASQYVDDAVTDDVLSHEEGNKLVPVVTAHKIIELSENRDTNDQPFVWVPFHFFPGNRGAEFTERLLCRREGKNNGRGDLPVHEMIDHYIGMTDASFSLELMGIAAHVYADTFSHFGFSGVSSRKNRVRGKSITPLNANSETAKYIPKKLKSFFRKFGFQGGLFENIKRVFMSDGAEILSGALGHGAVSTLPDLPYLEWEFEYEYEREAGETILSKRNNTDNFLNACTSLYDMFRTYAQELGDGHASVSDPVPLSDTIKDEMRILLEKQKGKTERCEEWQKAFAGGSFGIENEIIPPYPDKPKWDKTRDTFTSLDTPSSIKNESVYHFYQAASYHRNYLLRDLFPRHDLIIV